MKKLFITTLIISSILASCQKDDFCVDLITPNLIIHFYDSVNPEERKQVENLTVWADGLEELYTNVAMDSIALPLDPAEDFTTYHLNSGESQDQITINYTRKEVFVSRSCGYIYNFTELNLTDISNNWIVNSVIINETVEDDSEHLKILH
jgi:hypothetical protein